MHIECMNHKFNLNIRIFDPVLQSVSQGGINTLLQPTCHNIDHNDNVFNLLFLDF